MSITNYIKQFFASHVRSTYSYNIASYPLKHGKVEFANWNNPMVPPKVVTDNEIAFFGKFVQPGSFCIDIGANVGDTTVPMAVAAGREGLVLAFDPNPFVYAILEVNSNLNKDLTNIHPVKCAITEDEGEFYYNSSEASFGNGGVSAAQENHHGKFLLKEKIKGIKLDKYLNENYKSYLSKLSFIKVDVEGHDIDVLRSISELIAKHKPVLVAECFLKSTPAERIELYDLVHNLGYELYYFEDFDIKAEVIKLGRDDMNRWENFNFYAINTHN